MKAKVSERVHIHFDCFCVTHLVNLQPQSLDLRVLFVELADVLNDLLPEVPSWEATRGFSTVATRTRQEKTSVYTRPALLNLIVCSLSMPFPNTSSKPRW